MLKRYSIAFIVLMFSCVVSAKDIDMSNPYVLIQEASNHTFSRLKSEQEKIHQNPNYLKQIVKDELMPYINEQYAALKLLGPNLKGAKRKDVEIFINAFRGYLITSYAQVLTQYQDQKIKFGPKPHLDDKSRITTVGVEIVDSPNPNIHLNFKLRRSRSGEWQAFDMIAEGVSLLSSKQSEWNGKIRREGILAVAKELKSLANTPITFESKK